MNVRVLPRGDLVGGDTAKLNYIAAQASLAEARAIARQARLTITRTAPLELAPEPVTAERSLAAAYAEWLLREA